MSTEICSGSPVSSDTCVGGHMSIDISVGGPVSIDSYKMVLCPLITM